MSNLVTKKELCNELKIQTNTLNNWKVHGMPGSESNLYNKDEVLKWHKNITKPINELQVGEKYNNDKIQEKFKCSSQGGMRRSHLTNTLVLFSDHSKTNSPYEDIKWVDIDGNDIINYTGMGQDGDQSFDNAQNKTLKNLNELSIKVYLFETYDSGAHIFRGEVKLYKEPYMTPQKGRLVCIFPLLIEYKNFNISQKEFEKIERTQEENIKKQNKNIVYENAKKASERKLKKSIAHVQVYNRNPHISTHVKNRTHGRCDLCGEYAAFNDRNGKPYLECHHVEWLANGGEDSIENAVALDPTCHRKMHELDLAEDVEKLKSKIKEYSSRGL